MGISPFPLQKRPHTLYSTTRFRLFVKGERHANDHHRQAGRRDGTCRGDAALLRAPRPDVPWSAPLGYRLYRPETARRLHFIRRAKDLGFSLEEIAELLSLSDHPEKRAAEVKALVRARIADIEERIRDLERMRQGLSAIDGLCHGTGSTADCPILAALNREDA